LLKSNNIQFPYSVDKATDFIDWADNIKDRTLSNKLSILFHRHVREKEIKLSECYMKEG